MREKKGIVIRVLSLHFQYNPAVISPSSPPSFSKENSLGMRFVPIPGLDVLFGIWHVRVSDFKSFVDATGHDASQEMYAFTKGGWSACGYTWANPGFVQTPQCPVVGVNWHDAQAFCDWLTKMEGDSYRLPTDAEWSVAAGLAEADAATPKDKDGKAKGFPWGTQWPPPAGAGNYSGAEARNLESPADWPVIEGYDDSYPRTSPAGSFPPNRYGLYDMGGNAWQWCEDWYDGTNEKRVLRGASWDNAKAEDLLLSKRFPVLPGRRFVSRGFRVVLSPAPPVKL